ncbi:helix-turn-helix domain-containing protein [Tenacibaculum maritimum]|uniref:helix-turn-helix domain-containing protein n=1 Tax=Tenacibaculum maritimum TaxID=107401 RepID=UPI0012E4D7B9|nr:AraC family transcriptional regulator [Tenacibaculum maritimum]MCD9562575.1 AraC family transcriptional regulator [Tenacibaculum maritimum]MCD9566003.1 AraC family transcriptional regulator [Tenacibaculum maritimum]MCD9577746.1 AraC family transcriptional regulator [Tenacibaculum maritimum]MCD9596697.1 AraC family transcriptional regulator [Tenacibaculum maritimum]MCD9613527.1 AraC family transcriptional regulator [Tenacibaculum maritimum]
MHIDNIPEIYLEDQATTPDLFAYDFKMTQDSIKTKVNLNMHMFSFLQTGKKQVHFAGTSVLVNNQQSLLIKKGNCLWSELLGDNAIYFCKLLFFSEKKLREFLNKHNILEEKNQKEASFFVIENDAYITSYLNSLSSIVSNTSVFIENLLAIKFEELMLYLINKYDETFKSYLYSLISKQTSAFQKTIEKNIYAALTLEEIAFLCNMSLSTFKRHFIKEYNVSPGKWLREKRLLKAKELLEKDGLKSSEIYIQFGYNNLSNFSNAFKNRFGINPTDIK